MVRVSPAGLARSLWQRSYQDHRAWWLVRWVNDPVPDLPAAPGIEISCSDRPAVVSWLRQFGQPWMADEEEFQVAERNDHPYLCARREQEIVGYLKVGVRNVRVQDFGCTLALPAGMAMVYDSYVVPGERGRGIAPALIRAVLLHLRARDFDWLVCHIPPGNRASLRAYEKCGFRRLRMLHCRWLFGLKLPERGPRWLFRQLLRETSSQAPGVSS